MVAHCAYVVIIISGVHRYNVWWGTLSSMPHYTLLCSSTAQDIQSLVAGMEPSVNTTAVTILMLQRNISTVQQLVTDLDASIQTVSELVQI